MWLFKILFSEKYDYVGRLLKPGESHSYYTDEEETPTNKLHLKNPKQCEPENPKNSSEDAPLDKTKNQNATGDFTSNSNEKIVITKSLDDPAKLDDSLTLDK